MFRHCARVPRPRRGPDLPSPHWASLRRSSVWSRPDAAQFKDFTLLRDFLSSGEQRVLLQACLARLDETGSRLARRRRRALVAEANASVHNDGGDRDLSIEGCFCPDEAYDFEEGHFDGVIKKYREMHVSSWTDASGRVSAILQRIYAICPTKDVQTHLLHLSGAGGEILPHIDNVDASGSWIMGVSLGSARVLRLEHKERRDDTYELLLPSGSVYLQRDATRYEYKHSILRNLTIAGVHSTGGQRLSVMIRDHKP